MASQEIYESNAILLQVSVMVFTDKDLGAGVKVKKVKKWRTRGTQVLS